MNKFDGSICIRQRILTSYRIPFFEILADRCVGEVHVVAGVASDGESVSKEGDFDKAVLVGVVNRVQGSGVFTRFSQPELATHLESHPPSMFVTVANPRLSDMGRTVSRLQKKGVPAIGWGIGTTDFWNKPLKRLRQYYRKRFIRQFDGMLCYGSKAARQYGELGFEKERLFPIYNATVGQPSGTCPNRPAAFNGPAKILNIGRLIESKGIDRLIEAGSRLHSKGVELEIWIVGDGDDSSRLQGLAKKLNCPARFFGRKSGDELAKIALEADLFVLPGLGGLAIQEAMSFALPVIVTEADGTEEDLVRDNGWIVEKENINALADCLEQAIRDPVALRERGKESFRIVAQEINLERMADRFIDGLQTIRKIGIK